MSQIYVQLRCKSCATAYKAVSEGDSVSLEKEIEAVAPSAACKFMQIIVPIFHGSTIGRARESEAEVPPQTPWNIVAFKSHYRC